MDYTVYDLITFINIIYQITKKHFTHIYKKKHNSLKSLTNNTYSFCTCTVLHLCHMTSNNASTHDQIHAVDPETS